MESVDRTPTGAAGGRGVDAAFPIRPPLFGSRAIWLRGTSVAYSSGSPSTYGQLDAALCVPAQRANGLADGAVEVVLAGGGGRVDLVVSALRDDNPGPGLSVIDRGHDVAIRAPGRIVLTAATLLWHLGRGFDLRLLRPMVLSSIGRMEVSRDELVWTSQGAGGTDGSA